MCGTCLPKEARGEVSAPLQAVVFTSPVQGPLFPACLLSFPLKRPGSSLLSSSCCSASPRALASWEDAVCHSAGVSGVRPTGGMLSQRPKSISWSPKGVIVNDFFIGAGRWGVLGDRHAGPPALPAPRPVSHRECHCDELAGVTIHEGRTLLRCPFGR